MSESNKALDTNTASTAGTVDESVAAQADGRTYVHVAISSLIPGQLCERRLYVRLIKSSRYVLLVQPFTHLNESILDKLKKFDAIYSDSKSLAELFPAMSQTSRQLKIILESELATFEKIAKVRAETEWFAQALNASQTSHDINNLALALLSIFSQSVGLPTFEMVSEAEDDDVVKTSEALKLTAFNTLFELWSGTTNTACLSQQFKNYWTYFLQLPREPISSPSHEDWLRRLRDNSSLYLDVFDGVNKNYVQVEIGGSSVSA